MTLPTLALAAALPFSLAASDEQSFFHVPDEGDFRFQTVSRAGNEDWPFAVDEGYLACVYLMGQRQVYFMEKGDEAEGLDRALALSVDPFQLGFANFGQATRFAPNSGLEDLLRRIAPFVQVGRKLCDQPRGTTIGPGEL